MVMSRGLRRGISVLLLALLPAAGAAAAPETLDFVRKETHKRGPDDFKWGGIATDREELRRLWDSYEQPRKPPAIGFDDNFAVLAGTGGSSSCPTRLHDLRLDRENKRVVVRVYSEEAGADGACTSDWVTKTFTVAVAREQLKPLSPGELGVRVRRIEDPDG